MKVYLETSVILRHLLKQNKSIKDWGNWTQAYTSQLSQAEALRTLDRFRIQRIFDEEDLALLGQSTHKIFNNLSKIAINETIFNRVCLPFPTSLKTLDAIHLASALLLKEQGQVGLVFLTHDQQLGRGALAVGLEARGF